MAVSLVVLADDHQIVLEGLAQLFRLEPGFYVLARCTEGVDGRMELLLYARQHGLV